MIRLLLSLPIALATVSCSTTSADKPAPSAAAPVATGDELERTSGDFLTGTGNTYNGSRLAGGEQVVVVTINYRLGFFGWMSHPALRTQGRDALDASGNYANLDMIAALQWVHDNIANFGGDRNNVTIFDNHPNLIVGDLIFNAIRY